MTKRDDALDAARIKRRDLSSAMGDLEVAAQAPVGSGGWRGSMLLTLARLDGAFQAHAVVAEAPDGIIDTAVEEVPRLTGMADRLRAEHPVILDLISEIEDATQGVGSPTSQDDADRIRETVLDLLVALSRHRRRGSDFIWEAYSVDIGGTG